MSSAWGTLRAKEARERIAGTEFGGGNAWRTAMETSETPDLPALIADRPLINNAGKEQAEFSLSQLNRLAEAWSAWYYAQGVRPRDRVVVYISDSFEDQLHLTALAQIGVIPVLINGRMNAEYALTLMRRAEPVGLYTDPGHLASLGGGPLEVPSLRWTVTRDDAGTLGDATLPDSARFRHADDDPVVLCHTSGTTGVPKLVVWTHRQSVAGARFRLANHPEPDTSIMLAAIAQSHSGAIAFTFYALLAGLPLISVSDRSPAGISRAAAAYRPTTILAFHQTFAALANAKPDPADFASVADWMNTGDSAHDAHVRELIKLGRRTVDGEVVPGSVFGDALGASELGWAALRRVITSETPPSPRHLGKPVAIADVTVLREDGTVADEGEVGLLALRSTSLAPAYWNDSDTLYRSRLSGYRLSGDLVYRTGDDDYFHLDRVSDRIRTDGGDGYSVLMEEVLLLNLPEIADCAVVAGRDGEATVPVAVVRPHRLGAGSNAGSEAGSDADSEAGSGTDPDSLLSRANTALAKIGQPEIAVLDIAATESDIPVGPTEKVLKRRLREKYADLRAYVATRTPGSVAVRRDMA